MIYIHPVDRIKDKSISNISTYILGHTVTVFDSLGKKLKKGVNCPAFETVGPLTCYCCPQDDLALGLFERSVFLSSPNVPSSFRFAASEVR